MQQCRGDRVEVRETEVLTSDGRFLPKRSQQSQQDWLENYDCVDHLGDEEGAGNATLHLGDEEGTQNLTLVAINCPSVSHLGCLERTCIQKCCPFGYSVSSSGCEENPELEDFDTQLVIEYNNTQFQDNFSVEKMRVKTNFITLLMKYNSSLLRSVHLPGWDCSEALYQLYPDEYNIIHNGSLSHVHHSEVTEVTDVYCLDYFPYGNNSWTIEAVRCVQNVKEDINYLEDKSYQTKRLMRLVQMVLISISLVAILATLIVYLIIPDLRNLHGKIIISNLVAIGLVSLFLISTYSTPLDTIHHKLCLGVGYVGYYCILSMVVWMTTMCFDLCWTFSRAKIPSKSSEQKKFFIFSIFSWGLPALGTLVLSLFQLYLPVSSSFNPRIADFPGECFVARAGNRMRLLLYIPILVLMGVNVALFLIIVITIFISKSKTSNVRTSTRGDKGLETSRINRRTKEQLKLYMKLFVVVGLLWCGESLHELNHHHQQQNKIEANSTQWTAENQQVSNQQHTHYEWCELNSPAEVFYRIIDCLNLLRGLFLFLIFVCKRNILKKIQQRFSGVNRRPGVMTESKRTVLSGKLSADTSTKGRQARREKSLSLVRIKNDKAPIVAPSTKGLTKPSTNPIQECPDSRKPLSQENDTGLELDQSVSNPNLSETTVSDKMVFNTTDTDHAVSDPTVSNPTVSDPTVSDPTVSDPTVSDPTVSDPTVSDPTVSDPTVSDPTVSDPTVSDSKVSDPTVPESIVPDQTVSGPIEVDPPTVSNTTVSYTTASDPTVSTVSDPTVSGPIKLVPPVSDPAVSDHTASYPIVSDQDLSETTVSSNPGPTVSEPSTSYSVSHTPEEIVYKAARNDHIDTPQNHNTDSQIRKC